jgi:surface protein
MQTRSPDLGEILLPEVWRPRLHISAASGGCRNFNIDISSWDVGNVEIMYDMFLNAVKFDQPIGRWSVGRVGDMDGMFDGAVAFNQPLEEWDVGRVGKNTRTWPTCSTARGPSRCATSRGTATER